MRKAARECRTVDELAVKFDVSEQTMRKFLRKYAISRSQYKLPLLAPSLDKMDQGTGT